MDLELIQVLGKILERLDRLEGGTPPVQAEEAIPPPVLVSEAVAEPREKPVSEIGAAFKSRGLASAVPDSVGQIEWESIGGVTPTHTDQRTSSGHHLSDDQISNMWRRDQMAKVHPRTVEDELATRMIR